MPEFTKKNLKILYSKTTSVRPVDLYVFFNFTIYKIRKYYLAQLLFDIMAIAETIGINKNLTVFFL